MNDAPLSSLVRVVAAGDSALVAEFPGRIDPEINERATALAAQLRSRWGAILRDVVIGYCTVTVYFDPVRVDAPWLEAEMRTAAEAVVRASRRARHGSTFRVLRRWSRARLADVAASGVFEDDVVTLHTGRTYRVYMGDSCPGLTYLAEVRPRSRRRGVRRRARRSVPGSSRSPRGQPASTGCDARRLDIVGRTTFKTYDAARARPASSRSREVRFHAITRSQFDGGAP